MSASFSYVAYCKAATGTNTTVGWVEEGIVVSALAAEGGVAIVTMEPTTVLHDGSTLWCHRSAHVLTVQHAHPLSDLARNTSK